MAHKKFRHLTEEKENSIVITLPSQKKLLKIIWFVIWLVFWGLMTFMIVFIVGLNIATIKHTEGFSLSAYPGYSVITIIFSLFLFCLLALGALVFYDFLWQIGGKEIIKVNTRQMELIRRIFLWQNCSEYTANKVRNLRVIETKSGCAPIGYIRHALGRDGLIAFDYGAKKYRFGLDIEDSEANEIISKLNKKIHGQI